MKKNVVKSGKLVTQECMAWLTILHTYECKPLHCPMIQCHSTNHVNNEMDIVTQRLIECNCLFQVIANSLLLLCGNLIGYYYQFMNAKSQDKSFEQTRSTVESRVKLECEKEHQEQLLLSVIPAYIAAEVKQLFKLFCTVVFCANWIIHWMTVSSYLMHF